MTVEHDHKKATEVFERQLKNSIAYEEIVIKRNKEVIRNLETEISLSMERIAISRSSLEKLANHI